MSLDGITRVLAIKGFSAATMEAGTKRVDIWLERDGSGFRCARCGQVHLVAHDEHEVTVQDLPMTSDVDDVGRQRHTEWPVEAGSRPRSIPQRSPRMRCFIRHFESAVDVRPASLDL